MKKNILPLLLTKDNFPIPGFELEIKIGRKESINSINEARSSFDGKIIVGIQKKAEEDKISTSNLKDMGILSKIKTFTLESNTPKGKIYKLVIEGIDRVNFNDIIESKENGIIVCEYSLKKYTQANPDKLKKTLDEMKRTFNKDVFKTLNLPFSHEEFIKNLNSNPEKITNSFINLLPLSNNAKYEIVNEDDFYLRLEKIKEMFSDLKSINSFNGSNTIDDDISSKVKTKLTKQQKEFYLREKLKAIQDELDDITGEESEIKALRNKVDNNPYPKEIKEKAHKEIKKLESSQFPSAESNVIRNYLEWLLDVPYWQKTEEKTTINKVKKTLNKNHYGLKKIKERIIEHIAVKLNNPESKGSSILCFTGPPGTGKTSFAKSIAESLGRKFIKISLGGVKDEAEIRGHRRTYIGSMPGKIIKAMKKAGVVNPVILLDEIDKLSSDYKGDPSSALLEVMDFEQNSQFQDHFLEEDYDLSNVMFIGTANYVRDIPEPLYDRLEILEISSYTELEKINIANSHLIPRVIKETNVNESDFVLTNDILSYLIRHYTMEAGVRELYRVIESLARKTILQTMGKKKIKKLDPKEINKLLGPEIFDSSKIDNEPQIGTVQGLAWTQYGGDILPIEIILYEGKGDIVITGQLKDVMKESASIAFSFVKANYDKFGIDPIIKIDNGSGKKEEKNLFKDFDIHVHSPDGSTPKDGPSAGVTFTTALISAFSKKPVSQYLGMTGEITLRGKILPIGGLKEKSISAYRSGVKQIFVPKKNEKDLIHIPKEVKSKLKIVLVDNYFDLYKKAFSYR